MEITFLIGNGFDIGLHMPTRYEQFYKIYSVIKETDNDNIKEFKRMLQKRNDEKQKKIIDWADFERAFGEHSKDFSPEEKSKYLERFEDFIEEFNAYLEKVEACTNCSDTRKIGAVMDAAVKNYKNLRKADADEIEQVIQTYNSERRYNFISFNYTNALDKCVEALNIFIANAPYRYVGSIAHIHGYLDNAMIVGVNDPTQILNPQFSNDEVVVRELVKPQQNIICRTGNEDAAYAIINKSDIICIYGMSLGETDKKWWEYISVWLAQNDKRILIILNHDEKYKPKFPHSQDRVIRPIREKFLGFSQLNDEEKARIGKRIFIGINHDIFSVNVFNRQEFEDMITHEKSEEDLANI